MKRFFYILRRIFLRIKIAFNILFGRQTAWMFIAIPDRETLIKIIKEDKEYELKIEYESLRPFLVKLIMDNIGSSIDQTDLDLMRAQFQGEAELYKK